MTAVITERHRQAQLAVRARLLADLGRIWPALDWTQLDRTWPAWATAVAALVERYRASSTTLAVAYLRAFRAAAGVPGPAPVVPAPPVPAGQLETVLHVTAVAQTKAVASSGVAGQQAMAAAFVRSAGAISRLVLGAGRDTITASLDADPRARGWQRVTSGAPCEYCAGLAGEPTSERFRTHDGCGCSAEPVYR